MQLTPVLVRPMYAGNVGAAARVTANFGIGRLTLVEPACLLEDLDFRRMSMGAEARLEIVEVATLAQAVAEAEVVIATTSLRSRDPRGIHTPGEAFARAAAGGATRIAVVFGPERKGLSHEELRQAHMLMTVPTSPDYPVLNLAQAVAIVAAAWAQGHFAPPAIADPLDAPAPAGDLDAALAHLRETLLLTGYLDAQNPARVMDQIGSLLGRAVPSRREVAILRGIAAHLAYLWRRSGN